MKEKDIVLPSSIKNRVIKRYGVSTILFSLLIIAFSLIPVLMLFLPFFGVGDINSDPLQFFPMTTLDLSKGFLFQPNLIIQAMESHVAQFGEYETAMFILFFIISLLVFETWIIAFIQFCKGFKLLVYGRSSHMFKPIMTALSALISHGVLLAAGFYIVSYTDAISIRENFPLPIGISYIQFILLGVELLIVILMLIIYFTCFFRKLYLYDIDLAKYEYEVEVESFIPKEVTGIDKDVKEIKTHQYSKTTISHAHIPIGVPSIGEGAFSNCLHLTSVFIPRSVRKINANAFFNTPSLTSIKYNGTKLQWAQIKRGSNWLASSGTNIVQCKDGNIKVNVFK